jgi:hypothetical protein
MVSWPADAEESKLNCTQVKSHQCKAKPDGTLYDCKDVLVDKCTVVAGPGSGKALEVVTDTPGGPRKYRCSARTGLQAVSSVCGPRTAPNAQPPAQKEPQ